MPRDQVFSKRDSPASSPSQRRPADGAKEVTSSTKTPPTNSSTSELDSVKKRAESRLSEIPDGSSSVKCQAPDTESFIFDHATGYRFDPNTGLHYDANSGLFINHDLEILLRWDPLSNTYERAGDEAVLAKPVVFRAVDSSISAESSKSKKRCSVKCEPKRERASMSNERQVVTLVPYDRSPESTKNKRSKRGASRNKSESLVGHRKDSSRGGRAAQSSETSERSRGRCRKSRSVSRGKSPSRTSIRGAGKTREARSRSRVSERSTNRKSRGSNSGGRDGRCRRRMSGRTTNRESRRSTSRGGGSRSRNGSRHKSRKSRRNRRRERKRSGSREARASHRMMSTSDDRESSRSISLSPVPKKMRRQSRSGSRNRRSSHSDSEWIDRVVRSLGSNTSRQGNKPNVFEPPPKEKSLYPRDNTPSNPQPARGTSAGVEDMKKSRQDSSFTSHESTAIFDEKLVPKIEVSDEDEDEQIPDETPKDIIIDNGDMLGHLFTSDNQSVTNILLVAPVPLQNRSTNASDALKNQIIIGNPPDIVKVCVNHESTSGSPCSFMVIPFKSANSAKRWYDLLSGTIVLTGEDGSKMKAYLHFLKKGNWNCKHCKSFNFFMQSICSKCYVAKENGFSPVSISEGPTNYVGIGKLNNCFSTVKRVTDSLPPLDDFKILNIEMITEPGGFTLGLCVFEVESKEEGSKLHEFLLQRKRKAVYIVMNETPKTPDELYLDRLFDKTCVTNILFVALIPISNIPDMNLELTLMELYLIMLLKEDNVNYEKITLHVDKNCGAPYSHALITFADAETAAQWLKSRSRTFSKFSSSNQRSKVSLHFSEDNWKCESCQTLNFSCRSLCWHCFKHKMPNMLGPISRPLVSVTTKWIAIPVSSNWSETDDYIVAYFRELLKEFVFKGMEVLRDSKYQSLPLACVFEMHDKVESLRLKAYLTKEGEAAVFVVKHKELDERSCDDSSDAPDVVIIDEPPPACIDLTSDDNFTEDTVTPNLPHVNVPLVQRTKSSHNFDQLGPRLRITNYKQLIGGREQCEPQPPGPQSQAVETIGSWRKSVPPQPPRPQQLPAKSFDSWAQLVGSGPFLPTQQPPVLMNVLRPPVCQPSPLRTSYTVPFKNNRDIICVGPVFHPGKNALIFYTKLFLSDDCKSVRFCEANSHGVHYNYCLLYFKSPLSADEWYNERQGFIRIKYQKFPDIDIVSFEPHEAYLHILGDNWFCECSIENSPARSVCFRCYKQRGELEAPLEKSSVPTKYISLTLHKWYPASVLAENISARRCRSFKVLKIRYFSDPMINRDHFGLYVFEIRIPASRLRDFFQSLRIVKSSDYVVLKDPDAGAIIELDFNFNPVVSLRIVNDDRDFDSISGNMMEKVFTMGKSRKAIRPDYETFLWTSMYEYRLNNPPTNVVMISLCPGDRELPLQAMAQIEDSLEKAGVESNTLLYCFKGDVGSPFTYCLVFFESLDLAKMWFDKCKGIFEFNIPRPDEKGINLTFTNCFSQQNTSQSDKTYFIRSKLHYSYPNWLCGCGCPNFPLRSICHNCFGNKLDGPVRLNNYVSCPHPTNYIGIRLGKYFSNLDPSHLVGAQKLGYKITDAKICLDKSLPRDPCGVVIFRLSSDPEAIRFHAFLDRLKKAVNSYYLPGLMEVLDNSLGTTFLVCHPLLESNWFTYQSENWDNFFSNEVSTNVIAIYHQLLVGTFPALDIPVELYGGTFERFKRGGGFRPTFWLIFFPTPTAAQEWYGVYGGVLRNQDNHLNLYFTQGIWTCSQCSSANFPARVLCFKCYEHIGGGYSPLRLSASPTRWVGVPKQHSVAFECLGNTNIKLRSIRIVTDPIVRLDGPSVLVFEVSTPTVGLELRDILEKKKIGSSFFVVFEDSESHFAVGSECSSSEVSVRQTMAVTRRNTRDATFVPDISLIDNVGSNDAPEKTCRPNLTNIAISSTSDVEPAKGPLDVPVIEDLMFLSSPEEFDLISPEEVVVIMSDDETDGETTQQNLSSGAIPEREPSNLRPISPADEFREVVFPDYETLLWTSVYEYRLNNPPTDVVMISLCPGDRELPLEAKTQIQDSVKKAGVNCYKILYSFKGDVGSPFSYCLLYFESSVEAKTWFNNCNGIFEFKIPPPDDKNITLTFSNCFSQKSTSESDNPHYISSKLHFSYPNWLCSCGYSNFPLRSICHNCFGNKLGKSETLDGYVTCSHPGNFVGIRLSKYFSNLDPRHLVAVRKFQYDVSDAKICLDKSLPRDPRGIVIFELKSHPEAKRFHEYLTNLPKLGNQDSCLSGLMTVLNDSLGIAYLMCKPPLESNWFSYQSENWHSYFNNEIPTNIIAIYRHQLLNSNPPVSDSILRPYDGKIERFKRVGGFVPTFFLVSFPTPEYAKKWYSENNGAWKIKNEILALYFTQGFWACRQCETTNFPARVLCNRCYRHKTDGYSPLRLSASPTKWVGVTCPINSRQESRLVATLKEMTIKLRSLRIVTDPIVSLDGPSILVLEVSTLTVGVELRNFFIALHFDVNFFDVIERSESVCSLPEIPDQVAVTGGNPGEFTAVSEFDLHEPILRSKDNPDEICRQNAANNSVTSKNCLNPAENQLDGSVNVIEKSISLSDERVIAARNSKTDVDSDSQDKTKKRKRRRQRNSVESACYAALLVSKLASKVAGPKNAEGPRNPSQKASAQGSISDGVLENKETKTSIVPEPSKIAHPEKFRSSSSSDLSGAENSEELVTPRDTLISESNDETRWQDAANNVIASTSHLEPSKNPKDGSVNAIEESFSLPEGSAVTAFQNKRKIVSDAIEEKETEAAVIPEQFEISHSDLLGGKMCDELVIPKEARSSSTSDTSLGKNIVSCPTKPFKNSPPISSECPVPWPQKATNVLPTAMDMSDVAICPNYETIIWKYLYEYRLNIPPTNIVMISTYSGDHELPNEARSRIQSSLQEAGVIHKSILCCRKGVDGSPFCYCQVTFESVDTAKVWFNECKGAFRFEVPNGQKMSLTLAKLNYSLPNWRCSCGATNFYMRSRCHYCASVKSEIWDSFFEKGTIASSIVFQMGTIKRRKFQVELSPEEYGGVAKCFLKAPSGFMADFCMIKFANEQNAKRWYDANGGKLKFLVIKHEPTLYFTEDLWKCQYCNSSNFPKRVLCYRCYRHRTNGFSPVQIFPTQATKWVGINRPHDHKKAIDIVKKNEVVLRTVQIITDPNVRQDGTYLLLFEVATSKKGMELYNLFAKEIAVSKLGFFKVGEGSVGSIIDKTHVDCATIIEESTQKRNPVPDVAFVDSERVVKIEEGDGNLANKLDSAVETASLNTRCSQIEIKLEQDELIVKTGSERENKSSGGLPPRVGRTDETTQDNTKRKVSEELTLQYISE